MRQCDLGIFVSKGCCFTKVITIEIVLLAIVFGKTAVEKCFTIVGFQVDGIRIIADGFFKFIVVLLDSQDPNEITKRKSLLLAVEIRVYEFVI